MRNLFVLLCLGLGGCCLLPFASDDLVKHAVAKPPPPAAPPPPPVGPRSSAPPASPSQPPVGPTPVARPEGHLAQASFRALTTGAVPQAPDPRGLFDRAAGVRAERVEGGLLVCRVRVTQGGFDDSLFAGGADVFMTMRIGEGPSRTTPHRSSRVFTFPVEDLERGDALSVTVMDRDLFFHDRIGGGRADWAGGETAIDASPGAEVLCRSVDPATIERARARALRRISRAIGRLDRAEPDLETYDFAYPHERAAAVLAATREALAFMTLSDPALEEQIDRAVDFEDRWEERVQAGVDEANRELPAPGEAVRVPRIGELTVQRLACGAEEARARAEIGDAIVGTGCVLRLQWSPSRGGELNASDFEIWGVDADGGMPRAALEAARSEDGSWTSLEAPAPIRRGEPVELAVTFAPGTQPTLLRVRGPGRPVILRLE